ncbi:MAG: Xaa-Pro peptidase family protein [bacterium]|nr:Xaa-Pro peptidase family protein [bacterium]
MFLSPEIQKFLTLKGLDGWLLYDFRGNNPVLTRAIGKTIWTTRRLFVLITRTGAVKVVAHRVDSEQLSVFPGETLLYTDRHEMGAILRELLQENPKIAVEYSPECAIPVMSIIDAGMAEWLRSLGAELHSSADLVQTLTARWDDTTLENHRRASRLVNDIKDAAFEMIREALSSGQIITDYDVQQFILGEFVKENLEPEDAPVVATNERSGNPHYMPSSDVFYTIQPNDWILIDLWARVPGDENVFSDITWVGYAGKEVPAKHRKVYDVVTGGRDAALTAVEQWWKAGRIIQGWEIDEVCRKHISDRGYGKYFIHRTGHSLSPGKHVHGLGVNIDNFETHDTRILIPGIGFTIEPGVYFPEFGVRSEINVYIGENGPEVTSKIQREIL